MQHSAEFKRCLETIDVDGMRRLFAHTSPHLPQPANDNEALFALHNARTRMDSLTLKQRAYSNRWLCERGLPSALPDELLPSADRLYPRIVEGVGLSVNARAEYFKPLVSHVKGAMNDAIEDCYANGDTEPGVVRGQMFEARKKVLHKLIGHITPR